MDRETAKENIKSMLTTYLDTVTQKIKNKYICPLCGSGSGNNNNYTSAFSITNDMWHCFSCGNGGDIFTLIALQNNLDSQKDFYEVLNIAADVLNISISDTPQYKQDTNEKNKMNKDKREEKTINYSDFLAACKADVNKTDYYTKRGLERETIERFNLGYVTSETISKYQETCNLPKYIINGDVIIPYSKNYEYWIARDTKIQQDSKSNDNKLKWKKPKTEDAGKEPIFNESELDCQSIDPIFITEAPLDSISIMQVGGAAIAIGGTGQDKLKVALDSRLELNRSFIIAFDNPEQDKAGAKATEELKTILEARNINCYIFNFPNGVKDCNAFLMSNKDEFYETVQQHIHTVRQAFKMKKDRMLTEYNKDSGLERLEVLLKEVVNKPVISTGFEQFDNALDGGLYEGLYILGAISSLGKTTFILQIADQIAKNGKDVLIFSMEMSAAELIAKSISRETFLYCCAKEMDETKAKTIRDITDRNRYDKYSQMEKDIIDEAIKNYKKYANNIIIKQGIGDIGIKEIAKIVEQHKNVREKTPVIFIDYLQILAPYNERLSDKQNIDRTVLELKRMSRDYKIPIFVISSFNRDNYDAIATMAAFKESGAIEYSSDVLITIQPNGLGTDKENNRKIIDKCRTEDERNVEVVILKNRNGKMGTKIYFKYYSPFNCFEEKQDKSNAVRNGEYHPFINEEINQENKKYEKYKKVNIRR